MGIYYKKKTDKTFAEATDDLKKSLLDYKFGVLWELNFKDKLAEKGLSFDKNFKILEVCNPPQAKQILEKNIEVGYFLPCKIVVYEDNSSVFIGMLRPTQLIDMAGDDELTNIAANVENELKSAIESAI